MERSQSEALFSMLEALSKMNNREMTAEIFKIWLVALDPWPLEEIKAAFNRFVQTESGMPDPAALLRILRGSGEDRALSALMKVENAILHHGAYATVVFDDPLIHAVIQSLGGWIKACRQTEYEFTWWRKEFRERYRHYDRIGPLPDVPVQLSGIFDRTNLPRGEKPQKPVVIGDYEKAIGWVARRDHGSPSSLEEKNPESRKPETVSRGIPSKGGRP